VNPGGPWQNITPSTPAAAGSFLWTVPGTASSAARLRVSDAADGDPADTSTGVFTIAVSSVAVGPDHLDFGDVSVGAWARDTLTITNSGTGTLVVYSAGAGGPSFAPGRTSFSIPAGGSDTLGVVFAPGAPGIHADTLTLVTNAPGQSVRIPLAGRGIPVSSVGGDGAPATWFLAQNYPNPFNPSTEITFGVGTAGPVRLKVYDMLGREVTTLVDGVLPAGVHRRSFDAGGLAAGMYLYRLQAGGVVQQAKMLLLK
jgi:hypothetical protein